jgi:hypothetical protein
MAIINLLSCSKNQEIATCRKSERGDYYIEATNSYLFFPKGANYVKIDATYKKGAVNLNNLSFSEDNLIILVSSKDFSSIYSVKKDQCSLELRAEIKSRISPKDDGV